MAQAQVACARQHLLLDHQARVTSETGRILHLVLRNLGTDSPRPPSPLGALPWKPAGGCGFDQLPDYRRAPVGTGQRDRTGERGRRQRTCGWENWLIVKQVRTLLNTPDANATKASATARSRRFSLAADCGVRTARRSRSVTFNSGTGGGASWTWLGSTFAFGRYRCRRG